MPEFPNIPAPETPKSWIKFMLPSIPNALKMGGWVVLFAAVLTPLPDHFSAGSLQAAVPLVMTSSLLLIAGLVSQKVLSLLGIKE